VIVHASFFERGPWRAGPVLATRGGRSVPETLVNNRHVVVVGASAGGVRALLRLAAQLPAGFPAPVCTVLHVGSHASRLPELLSAAGANPAVHARSGERLQPGRIHVAPPDHHLLLQGDVMRLTRGPREHHTRPAIDPLFRSTALSAGPRAVGVLLTGSLDDGVAGLQAIKQCGGQVVVQDPHDAQEPGMPLAALRAVHADHCVSLPAMGELLVRLVTQPVAAGPLRAPARLEREHAAGLTGKDSIDDLRAVSAPSTLACPDCGGVLWEIEGAAPPRYRCHTGHAYSLFSLGDAQAQATEQALWAAIRALHERELLLRKVADVDRSAGDEQHAGRATEEADSVARQMQVLRELAERG
jgi:two-component system chemotaxis response regulator CheB